MKIYKTMMSISDDPAGGGNIYKADTIKHEGQMWIVPEWIDIEGEGWSKPARLILLDYLPHQVSNGDFGDYILNSPIPISVWNGQVPPELKNQYIVIEAPDLKVPRSH